MSITPDTMVFWEWGPITLNATIVFTWAVMALLVVGSWLVTRGLSSGRRTSRWQTVFEYAVTLIRSQIRDVAEQDPLPFLPFVGTLFTFILISNLLTVVPGFQAPTASLSTTAALSLCVFIAVPIFGISKQGLGEYLRSYLQPSVIMLPFNIIGEFSRTLALAIRLYGNVMSGSMIVAILVSIVPLLFPVIMELLGLLTGVIQAYIFAILATMYISSSTRSNANVEPNQ